MNNHIDIIGVLEAHSDTENAQWFNDKISKLAASTSAKDLYMTYSLLGSKYKTTTLDLGSFKNDTAGYFKRQEANLLQVARIALLSSVLNANVDFYTDKVANIIQVADTGELETFLKFLILLPNPEAYKHTAVDALRTNIATVFDAIAMNNPYPARYFSDQQWNQMYLKTIFMDRDLSKILDVDIMANEDLTRIISDYAHERWAASRKIDPLFWRPVSKFLNDYLLIDMKQLLDSEDAIENGAGALCCFNSENKKAMSLLDNYKELKSKVSHNEITWETLKN